LVQQLAELPGHDKRWAFVIDFTDRVGYVQFLGRPDGSLQCECQSNLNRPSDLQLNAGDEEQLLQLGWQRPEPPQCPNWYNIASSVDGTALGVSAVRAVSTLTTVFRATETDDLNVKLISYFDSGDAVRIPALQSTDKERSPSGVATRPSRSAPKQRSITIARSEGRLRALTSSGKILAEASDATALVVSAQEMDESPLVLARGSALTLLLPRAERAIIMEALEPDDSLADELFGKLEELMEDEAFIDLSPISARNRIDDQRWGWVPLVDTWGASAETRLFGIYPIGKASELARFSAWMSASMTGAVISSGLRHRGPHAVVWVDNDPDPDTATAYYEVENFDDLLWEVLSWEDPLCPVCDEDDASGWELDLSVGPTFLDLALGRALTRVWVPCPKHESRKVRLEAAGCTWRWARHRWEPDVPHHRA